MSDIGKMEGLSIKLWDKVALYDPLTNMFLASRKEVLLEELVELVGDRLYVRLGELIEIYVSRGVKEGELKTFEDVRLGVIGILREIEDKEKLKIATIVLTVILETLLRHSYIVEPGVSQAQLEYFKRELGEAISKYLGDEKYEVQAYFIDKKHGTIRVNVKWDDGDFSVGLTVEVRWMKVD